MTRAQIALGLAATAALSLSACDKAKPRAPAPPAAAMDTTGPAPAAPGGSPMPALPAWANDYMGKPIATLFPGPPKTCVGNTDNVEQKYGGASPGVQIVGWGWDPAAKAPIARVLLVDITGLVAGVGETGIARPDVNKVKPEITSPTTGWAAYTSRTLGPVDTYGILADGKSVCVLGHLVY
ncbi:MAG: hypothetical protein JF588_08245 [Caulobacterales bacterium]|nr:hypothetical protein [Caulobacterales bacterium]